MSKKKPEHVEEPSLEEALDTSMPSEEELAAAFDAPPKSTAGAVRPVELTDAQAQEMLDRGHRPVSLEDLQAIEAGMTGDPLPPRAPIPRGPFVRYHETEERSLHAVVTAVHEDGSVNLHVFPDGPRVNYLQKVPHGYDPGCWEDYL